MQHTGCGITDKEHDELKCTQLHVTGCGKRCLNGVYRYVAQSQAYGHWVKDKKFSKEVICTIHREPMEQVHAGRYTSFTFSTRRHDAAADSARSVLLTMITHESCYLPTSSYARCSTILGARDELKGPVKVGAVLWKCDTEGYLPVPSILVAHPR